MKYIDYNIKTKLLSYYNSQSMATVKIYTCTIYIYTIYTYTKYIHIYKYIYTLHV